MAGESARSQAEKARQQAARLLADADKWERGAAGEARTAAALSHLGPEWVVWHDLAWPGRRYANIDHVAIGPSGIFVIDSKNWSGTISVRDGVLRQNGYRREKEVAGCSEAALAVGSLVLDFLTVCRPVMCFTHDTDFAGTARDVTLCSVTSLITVLTTRPPVMDNAQVARVAKALRSQLTSKPGTTVKSPSRRANSSRQRSRGRRSPAAAVAMLAIYGVFALIAIGAFSAFVQHVAESAAQPPTSPAPSAGPSQK